MLYPVLGPGKSWYINYVPKPIIVYLVNYFLYSSLSIKQLIVV